jgi:hypothetical protein
MTCAGCAKEAKDHALSLYRGRAIIARKLSAKRIKGKRCWLKSLHHSNSGAARQRRDEEIWNSAAPQLAVSDNYTPRSDENRRLPLTSNLAHPEKVWHRRVYAAYNFMLAPFEAVPIGGMMGAPPVSGHYTPPFLHTNPRSDRRPRTGWLTDRKQGNSL